LLALALLLCGGLANAQVAPTSEFQLDGTAAKNPGYPPCIYTGGCDFWDLLNGPGGPNPTGAAGSSAGRTFVSNLGATQAFIGGGSKDPNDLTSWSCTTKSSPNKDTLTNGYAAGYTNNTAKDLVLVFGADRLSTSGDANIGIWFFQENVHCDAASGTFQQANGTAAAHTKGDIFAVSAFTIGGTTPNITVYMWNPACTAPGSPMANCADSNLQTLFSVTVSCDSNGTLVTGPACAITNSANVMASWPYPTATSATPSTIPAQALFMGGIDITYLLKTFGGLTSTPCFGSFLEETRSSQTTSAVLKDFIGSGLNFCKLDISKVCSTGANAPQIINNGTEVQYTFNGLITNTGIGTLSNITLKEGVTGGIVTAPTPTTLNAGQSATYSVVFTSTALSFTNTATASGSFGSQVINSEHTAMATCTEPVSSTVTVVKHCGPPGLNDLSCSGSGCVVLVPIAAQVCNTGTVQLTNIQISDTPTTLAAMTPNGFTLDPNDCTGSTTTTACNATNNPCTTSGYTCKIATGQTSGFCAPPPNPTGTYMPTSFVAASNGVDSGRFLFDDTVSVTSATAALGSSPTAVTCTATGASVLACAGQTCPLCPQGECSGSPLP
jgi:hypothetical protein